MSFTGNIGPLLKRLAPAVLLLSVLLLCGMGAFAQTEESSQKEEEDDVVTASQSKDTDIEADQVPQEVSAEGAEIPQTEEIIAQGKQLFTGNCTVCHALNEVVVGPALAGIHERRPLPWIKAFIVNSQRVIQSGDAYAVNLFNTYNKTVMPSFNFSDEELTAIIAYLKYETENAAQGANEPAESVAGNQGEGAGQAGNEASAFLTTIVVALVVVLVLVLVVLILVSSVLLKYLSQRTDLDEEDKEIVNRQFSFGKLVKSRSFLGVLIFIFVAVAIKTGIDGLYSIGIQQGYQPEQPIAFSHKLHAGQYQINCNYCHTGVYKAKSANIPSVNICMNCHNTIKKDSPEIQKLYAAVETNTPIEWVRVHNLPDLAYFNHAQHVNVGGIECQTCHGPVQEMEVVYQHAELTMGWCINCHRETAVKTEDNDYYDKLVKLHNANTDEPMTVEDIGGLECAKCHY